MPLFDPEKKACDAGGCECAHEQNPADALLSLLSAIVNSADDAIVTKSLDGRIVSWNRAAERMFGYTAAEAIGKSITLIIPPERRSEEAEILARVRNGWRIDHYETVRCTKDGRILDISLTVSPIRDSSNRIIGASKMARDITNRKRLEYEREELLAREQAARQEAQRANDLLQEAQRANDLLNAQVALLRKEVSAHEKAQAELAEAVKSRERFLAIASHELRNPLNVLVLTLQLLAQASEDAAVPSNILLLLNRFGTQLDRLTMLVERLFDVSRIRSGKLELSSEKFDLIGLIMEVAGRFADQGSTIQIYPARPAVEVYGDPTRIDQAIANLVSNAVKFGEQKPIEITVDVTDDAAVIRIRDQGIGLAPAELERVFALFEQGSATAGSGGLGVGLWITKAIAEAHGGSIVAESKSGKGSVFTLVIPLQRVSWQRREL